MSSLSARRSVLPMFGDDAPVEADLPAGDGRQAEDRPADRGLARARLADQAERLAGADVQRDAVQRLERRLAEARGRDTRRRPGRRRAAARRRCGRRRCVSCLASVLRRSDGRERGAGLGVLEGRVEQHPRVRVLRVGEQLPRPGRSRRSRPVCITATWSQMSATTPKSWVTRIMPMLRSCWSERIRSSTSAWTVTSSAVVGSSAISSSGSQDTAPAMSTRWAMPPEIWCG